VEVWISKLRDSVGDTLKELNFNIIMDANNNIAMEEWAYKVIHVLHYWLSEIGVQQ
jgi:hypothetical protein